MRARLKPWLKWMAVGLLLVGLGFLAHAYEQVTKIRKFERLQKEGQNIIASFKEIRPESESANSWANTVTLVHNTWGNVVYSPARVPNETVVILNEGLREMRRGAGPTNALEQLDLVFDQLLRVRPEQTRFIIGMREAFREAWAKRVASVPTAN